MCASRTERTGRPGPSARWCLLSPRTGREPICLIVGAGLLMILLDARPRAAPGPPPPGHRERRRRRGPPPYAQPCRASAAAGPLGTLASAGALTSLGLLFLKTGALVFGSGLAIVPLLRDGVAAQHHWLAQAQFLDAVAMGLITADRSSSPRPPSSPRSTSVSPSPAAGSSATKQIKAFVTGATAAGGGARSGAVVVLTRQAVTDATRITIAVVTLALLWRFKKRPEP